MNRWHEKIKLPWLKQVLWNLLLISLGSVLCAISVNGILIPQKFLSAGFTGLALGIHYLVPALPVSSAGNTWENVFFCTASRGLSFIPWP